MFECYKNNVKDLFKFMSCIEGKIELYTDRMYLNSSTAINLAEKYMKKANLYRKLYTEMNLIIANKL